MVGLLDFHRPCGTMKYGNSLVGVTGLVRQPPEFRERELSSCQKDCGGIRNGDETSRRAYSDQYTNGQMKVVLEFLS